MNGKAKESGMALLVVIVIIALLTTALTELAYSTLVDLRLAETFRDSTRAYFLAKGGINAGRMIVQEDDNDYDGLNELWSQGVVNYPVGDGAVTVRITDQDGKFGINSLVVNDVVSSVAVDRFYRLFIALELDDIADPAELVAALVDWLDLNDAPYRSVLTDGAEIPVAGAESAYYQGLERPYAAANGRLDTLDELKSVKGFTPEVLARVLPHVGLHETLRVNLNTASAEVLVSLSPEIDAELAELLVKFCRETPARRLEQIEDILPVTAYSALKSLGNLGRLGLLSNRYRIESDAVVNDGRRRLAAEIDKQGNQLLFFKVN